MQALIDTVMASKETVTIVAIGPAPNLEVALQREPRLAQRARFVGMYGSLYRGYGRPRRGRGMERAVRGPRLPPRPRGTLADAPDAARTPAASVRLRREMGEGPERLRIPGRGPWSRTTASGARRGPTSAAPTPPASSVRPPLYDTVAVYLAFRTPGEGRDGSPGGRRGDDHPDPTAPKRRWAVEWNDLGAFEDLLVERLIAGR